MFRLPNSSSRVSISGSTGSGKTRFGIWLFGTCSDFKVRPHVIIDYKGDDLIQQIEGANEISLSDKVKHAGLYIVRPKPNDEIEPFLEQIYERGNAGLFFDEGYMIDKFSPMFNAILTQGRSLKIPAMVLTQRPTFCSRFIFSEASYAAVFRFNDARDALTASAFVDKTSPVFDFRKRLPEFHCRWYDAAQDYSCVLKPVPDDQEILDIFASKLKVKHRGI